MKNFLFLEIQHQCNTSAKFQLTRSWISISNNVCC